MKTTNQKKAKELVRELPRLSVIHLNTRYAADMRCKIGDEIYVNISCLKSDVLNKLRRIAKKGGWRPSDLFPAVISSHDYGCVTHVVRLGALEDFGRERLKKDICSDSFYNANVDEALDAARQPWDGKTFFGINDPLTDEQCAKAIETLKERSRLIRLGDVPDIDTCIRILKENGYRIMKPVTEYKEV